MFTCLGLGTWCCRTIDGVEQFMLQDNLFFVLHLKMLDFCFGCPVGFGLEHHLIA